MGFTKLARNKTGGWSIHVAKPHQKGVTGELSPCKIHFGDSKNGILPRQSIKPQTVRIIMTVDLIVNVVTASD